MPRSLIAPVVEGADDANDHEDEDERHGGDQYPRARRQAHPALARQPVVGAVGDRRALAVDAVGACLIGGCRGGHGPFGCFLRLLLCLISSFGGRGRRRGLTAKRKNEGRPVVLSPMAALAFVARPSTTPAAVTPRTPTLPCPSHHRRPLRVCVCVAPAVHCIAIGISSMWARQRLLWTARHTDKILSTLDKQTPLSRGPMAAG
ncbi:hypothetical protein TW95_gp1428 [Pandoravirus inopinatum]|uniref:Uncharacterized protein n=1 Tax=Pandoravirus inopinatum TaxID=1605721 RepID=A0A0B5JEH7_9VIRU|nr:hypothetical protein TW95_gp1428 [Pandoravirus inopinatum]AJF98162.1 hypothetical protein [Pandoravirus inopinatum]